jgi:hypoxanthine phosphoribosyltransferase
MSRPNLDEIKQVYIESDLLFSESEVAQAIDKMGAEISADLADQDPVIFSIMNGGLVIGGQLLTRLNFPLEASYLHATRYRNTTSGHELEWKVPPMIEFKGRPVLVVDDILDEGHTLVEVMKHFEREGASSVEAAVLIDKEHDRKAIPGLKARYTGLTIPDRYIFGYGMDYKGYWRNAPGIFAVKGL